MCQKIRIKKQYFVQIIIDKKDQINFIEIAARLPGGSMLVFIISIWS